MPTTNPPNLERQPVKQFRRWINRNSKVVNVVSVLILIACLLYLSHDILWNRFHPPKKVSTSHSSFVWDLETGKLRVVKMAEDGSPTSPNAQMLVRAIVFSCGNCKDESKRFVGYVESFTPEAKASIKTMMEQATQPAQAGSTTMSTTQPMGDPMMFGRQIMDPKKDEWFSMDSPAASELLKKSMSKCGEGKYPTQCFPDDPDYDVVP